jgi:hypothetical protein
MSEPTRIIVEEVNEVNNVVVSSVDLDVDGTVETIALTENAEPLIVQIANVDTNSLVQSVNGKTGHVVIDYPDINANPVNHVKYVHTQTTVSNDWTVTHNLGFFPNVTILDNDTPPRIIEADIRYLNTNSVRIIMNTAMSGVAYLT